MTAITFDKLVRQTCSAHLYKSYVLGNLFTPQELFNFLCEDVSTRITRAGLKKSSYTEAECEEIEFEMILILDEIIAKLDNFCTNISQQILEMLPLTSSPTLH